MTDRLPKLSPAEEILRCATVEANDQKPDWENPVAAQLYGLRSTLIYCTHALVTAVQNGH